MSFMKFGEFLVKNSNGKVLGQHIAAALMKQKMMDGHMKLGEILVEEGILDQDEMDELLEQFMKLT